MRQAQLRRIASSWLVACLVGLFALEAGAHGQALPGSNMGPQSKARIQIRVSVRPMLRIGPTPGPATSVSGAPGSLCLWSNFEPGQYDLRAEWSDGEDFEPGDEPAVGKCGQPGMGPARLLSMPGREAGQAEGRRLVMLMIEAR